MRPLELKTQRVLIVGYGVTGASVARFLIRRHLAFDIVDEGNEKSASKLAQDLNCQVYTEFNAELFKRYNVLVLSPGIPRSTPAVVQALQAGVDVIGDIELFADVVDKPVIAVTGSNGKSTVVAWIAHALQSTGLNAIACGNIGQPALDCLLSSADVYVLELSSYQLESTRSLKPLSAAVLNVSDDHLDRYDDIDHYAAVKRTILKTAEHCVVNRDDVRTWPQVDSEQAIGCEYFSLSLSQANQARWHQSETDKQIWLCDNHVALLARDELPLPGNHNVANALAVVALIEPLAVPFKTLKKGLISFTGLPHRSEYLGEQDGVRWYNDSKGTNIDACSKAVLAMPGPVILIAGGISKGADFNPLREIVEQRVRLLVLIGRDRDLIEKQLAGVSEIVMADDLREAVSISQRRSRRGDVVLLSPACSSFDMFENFEDRGEQFSTAVQEVLAA